MRTEEPLKELNKLDKIINSGLSLISPVSSKLNSITSNIGKSLHLISPSNTHKVQKIPIVRLVLTKNKYGRKTEGKTLTCLLDSGASHSLIKHEFVEHLMQHASTTGPTVYDTAGGQFEVNKSIRVSFMLPEFSSNATTRQTFDVFEGSDDLLGYDVVIGRDMLKGMGIDIRFSDETIAWEGTYVNMLEYSGNDDPKDLKKEEIHAMLTQDAEPLATKELTKRMVRILDAEYEAADLDEICSREKQLSNVEKQQLKTLLTKYKHLFDGSLGQWRTEPAKAELKEGAKPVDTRYYPIPKIHREVFRKELQRLVELGVLRRVAESAYGSPAFLVPKPDGRVRFVTDFRKVNQTIKRKPYPLPRISETLQNLEGFRWATAMDLNMGYWTIRLDPETRDMTTITTEWGKFQYNVLPMGFVISGDVFQSRVMDLLGAIEGIRCYIDDVLCITKGSFEEHLERLEQVFVKLDSVGLRVNPKKSNFGMTEVKYLGYVISRDGIKPDSKKIQGILDMERPKTVTEMKALIGMVQFYRDMWKQRSHILSPLVDATTKGKGKTPINWTPELNAAWLKLRDVISGETLLRYPDWNIPFEIHSDASDYQLGAVLSQEGKPIAFFSRRLSKAQMNYTTTEKELLSIVECLKQFRHILQGYPIKVYSDHKNLAYCATLSESQRVMRWRMILEEFNPTIEHIAGVDNVVADALSRIPSANSEDRKEKTAPNNKELFAVTRAYDEGTFPLDRVLLQQEQLKELRQRSSKLQQLIDDQSSEFHMSVLDDIEFIMYRDRLYVPKTLRERTLGWFHHYLNHPGGDRLGNTIGQTCYWPGLMNEAKRHVKRCKICNEFKVKSRKYGHLPPKIVGELKPWDTVHIDLIGPYSVTINQTQANGSIQKKDVQLTCMTMIDPATGWFEIAEVPSFDIEDVRRGNTQLIDKTSARISRVFNQIWLSRYPRPRKVILDNGSEFKKDFLVLLKDFDIKATLTTVENPQANAPVERVHQVIQHMLATKDLENMEYDFIDPWGEILSSVAWAIRASYHSILKASPGQLIYGQDMIFNMNKVVDWKLIEANKQQQVIRDNIRENLKRVDYDYKVGDKVMLNIKGVQRKLSRKKKGPFKIIQVFTNGDVLIEKGSTSQRVNIRRIEPIFE